MNSNVERTVFSENPTSPTLPHNERFPPTFKVLRPNNNMKASTSMHSKKANQVPFIFGSNNEEKKECDVVAVVMQAPSIKAMTFADAKKEHDLEDSDSSGDWVSLVDTKDENGAENVPSIIYYSESSKMADETEKTRGIHSAITNLKFDEGTNLAKVLAEYDENKAVDAAAVMVDSQKALADAECKLTDLTDTEVMEKLQNKVHDLENELAASQKIVEGQKTQKQRMVATLKKKKGAMQRLHKKINELEIELAASRKTVEDQKTSISVLTNENGALRRGLEAVKLARDSLKSKLCSQKETTKEARTALQTNIAKTKSKDDVCRLKDELLNLYRGLATHTGRYKWGKSIRDLEAKVAVAIEASGGES